MKMVYCAKCERPANQRVNQVDEWGRVHTVLLCDHHFRVETEDRDVVRDRQR